MLVLGRYNVVDDPEVPEQTRVNLDSYYYNMHQRTVLIVETILFQRLF